MFDRKSMGTVCVLVLLGALGGCYGYSSGAPDGACDAMTPNHGVPPQNTTSGVSIQLSKTTFACGETINVTLAGKQLKGFLCQARPNPDIYSTTGMFNVGPHKEACGTNAGITHQNGAAKNNINFEWKQSGSPQDFNIVCTFVQEKNIFWVKEQSSKITSSCNNEAPVLVASVLTLIAAALMTVLRWD